MSAAPTRSDHRFATDPANERRWDTARGCSPRWLPPALPTTVVVPHPDDEALLFGGLIALQRDRDVDVTIIAVTDGEAAYPGVDTAELARTRRREQDLSLRRLGVASRCVHRLGVPDGEVAANVAHVAAAVADAGTPLVIAPWKHDHHCDHEACATAAEVGAGEHGASVWSGLFWAWNRTDPRLLSGHHLVHLRMSASMYSARRSALHAHRSQLRRAGGEPILPAEVLTPMRWHREYFVAPDRLEAVPS